MYSFEYMKKDKVLSKVLVDDDNNIKLINYTDDIIDRPFGTCENPSMTELEKLYEERCFPESRANAKQILKGKLYGYDPISIIYDTHGVLADDYYWIRFEGENLCWDDVKHWKFH